MEHVECQRALAEQVDQTFDALIRSLLIVQSVALDGVEKSLAIFRHAWNGNKSFTVEFALKWRQTHPSKHCGFDGAATSPRSAECEATNLCGDACRASKRSRSARGAP